MSQFDENECWLENDNFTFRIEDILTLGDSLTEADTNISLETSWDNIHLGLSERSSGNQFSRDEREYARMMIRLGFTVYREPVIKDCNHLPDFYICDPDSHFGVLVEITKSTKKYLSERKRRQIKSLEEIAKFYNIPFFVLFKEDLDRLKGYDF